MSYLHVMPITNINHNGCRYTVELGVSAKELTRITLDKNHAAYIHICLLGIGYTTIVSAENQNGTIIAGKAIFFFCHYCIVWESNTAGEARGQSWNESPKSRCIPRGLCRWYERYTAKTFCCGFFATATMAMVAATTIVLVPPPPVIGAIVCNMTTICCKCLTNVYLLSTRPIGSGSNN